MLSGSTAMGTALLCALVLSLPCSFTAVALVRGPIVRIDEHVCIDRHRGEYPNSDHYRPMTRRPALVQTMSQQLLHSAPSSSTGLANNRLLCHVTSRFRTVMEG